MRARRLTPVERNTLLASVTEDVATAVLADSDHQMLAISLAAAATEHFDRHARLIGNLQSAGGIDPARKDCLPRPNWRRGIAADSHDPKSPPCWHN
uniref:NAD-glutamate dehydrogenase domain-containing protein n=1 Tax=Rhodococcus qingshengii TaxID=334542 RepID=UPI0027E39C1E|nr:NAD-glutamate dehydrogenase domain-containing protein [Rhodococcus qingshengii]